MAKKPLGIALDDLYDFLVVYWGLDLKEQPHREMCEALQTAEADVAHPYVALIVPRDCFKSSIARGTLVWKQLRQVHRQYNPYHRIALVSATLSLSKQSLRVIENQLRYNKRITDDFGALWSDGDRGQRGSSLPDAIVLAPRIEAGELASVAEPSFWLASERRISTGYHCDEIFVDDLNNDQNCATMDQREKIHRYWGSLFPLLDPHTRTGEPGKISVTATRYHDDDVVGRILRNEEATLLEDKSYKSQWNVLQRKARWPDDETGVLFFPSRLSHAVLDGLKRKLPIRQYANYYLNDPGVATGFVQEDQIKFLPRTEFPQLRDIRITVDPNQHKEAKTAGCYAAMVVSGYDRFMRMWVLDACGSRTWGSGEFIDNLFALSARYSDPKVFIEDIHMAHFEHAIRLEEERRTVDTNHRVRLRLHWYSPDRGVSKFNRYEKLEPRFRAAAITFAEEIPPSIKAEIKEELVRGSSARFQDFLDALAMAENGVIPRIDPTGAMQEFQEKAPTQAPEIGSISLASVLEQFEAEPSAWGF